MIDPVQQAILDRLAEVCELSDDVRFGQMIDFLAFLGKDQTGRSLAEINDEELLQVIERHRDDLARRQAAIAGPQP